MNEHSSKNKQNNQDDGQETKKRGFFKSYLHYGFNPQIGKRLKDIGYHFGHFAYLFAMIYGAVRLIKPNHPTLNPANIGKFGFRDVISAAAENVTMKRENIDQILVFFTVLFGLSIMAIQVVGIFFLVGIDAFLSQAQAQPLASLFSVPNPENDLALHALEMVFGTDMFGANAPQLPMIGAFHAMLSLFSSVALIIGIFLLIYYVFVVVSEAAMTGTPFGRRFNGLWAPIRLVVAFGLLIPVASGLNAAQYITLYMAKAGSNLASNAWATFADTFMDPQNFIAIPSASNMQEVVGNIFVNELCRYSYNLINERLQPEGEDGKDGGIVVRARVPKHVINEALADLADANITGEGLARSRRGYEEGNLGDLYGGVWEEAGDALSRGGRNIFANQILSFGWKNAKLENIDPEAYVGLRQLNVDVHWTKRQDENRAPDSKCGAIRFHLSASDNIGILPLETLVAMRAAYLKAADRMVTVLNSGETAVGGYTNVLHAASCAYGNGNVPRCNRDGGNIKDLLEEQNSDLAGTLVGIAHSIVQEEIITAIESVSSGDEALKDLNEELKSRGWASAGAYFNTIARINGEIYDAANEGLPSVVQEPTITIAAEATWNPLRPRRFLAGLNQFAGRMAGRDSGLLGDSENIEQTKTMNSIMLEGGSWFAEGLDASDTETSAAATPDGRFGRWLGNFIGDVFGAGLLDMRENLSMNPLGQLAMGGKSLIGRSIMAYGAIALINSSMGFAAGITVGGILAQWIVPVLSMLMTIGLGAGFVLYFLVPMLPFMYFIFAVVGWVSEIFEAIVAMPLWALAHIRIEGDGLPGQAASAGYYLIFAIFTRPIFIVFGLIGAYASFMVGIYLLHNTFDIAVQSIDNQTGFQAGLFDSLGFTIIYVIIVYNMANTSFQMIDQVPNQIMRWFGSPATSFSDGRQVDMQSMQQFAGAGAGFLGRELGQGQVQSVQGKAKAKQEEHQGKKNNKRKAQAIGKLYGSGDSKKEAAIAKQAQSNLDNGLEGTEGIDTGKAAPPPPPAPSSTTSESTTQAGGNEESAAEAPKKKPKKKPPSNPSQEDGE